jgi:hypothetical protein
MKTLLLKTLFLVLGVLLGFASWSSATIMGDLAAQMQPGTWAQLTTSNMMTALTSADFGGGATNIILYYADGLVWDPNSHQAFFSGGDHNWGIPTTVKFVTYVESANSWQENPTPPYASGVMHGYDHNAIDPTRGFVYHRPYNTQAVWRYNISTKTWSQLPAFPYTSDYNSCCEALVYNPDLNGLLWVSGNGNVYLFKESTAQWSRFATWPVNGNTWTLAEYNPIQKLMIMYDGGANKLYKTNNTGQVTQLGTPPALYNGSNGLLTIDPMTGDYIALTGNNLQPYKYNVVTDTWTILNATNQPDFSNRGVVATPMSNYGVIFFATCTNGGGSCNVYLYKHASGSGTDTTPPTVSITAPTLGATVSGTITVSANASDTVGVAGVQFKVDGANLGAEDTSSPYSVSLNTTTLANGSHTLTAVARDTANNTATSAGVSISVSNSISPPRVPMPISRRAAAPRVSSNA